MLFTYMCISYHSFINVYYYTVLKYTHVYYLMSLCVWGYGNIYTQKKKLIKVSMV